MTGKEKKNLIFDTSALIKLVNDEKGSAKVSEVLENGIRGGQEILLSPVVAHEFLRFFGSKNVRRAATDLAFFESISTFESITCELAKNAAFLRMKHPELGLSTADSLIIQLGIETDSEIVTADKVWKKIDGADIRLV